MDSAGAKQPRERARARRAPGGRAARPAAAPPGGARRAAGPVPGAAPPRPRRRGFPVTAPRPAGRPSRRPRAGRAGPRGAPAGGARGAAAGGAGGAARSAASGLRHPRPVRGRAWSQPRGVSGPRGNIFPVKWVTGGAEEREGASPWGTRGFRRGLRKRRVPRAGPPDRRARAQAPGRSPSAVVAPAREAGARRQAGSPGPGAWGPVAGSERRPPGLSLEITLGLWPPVGSAGGARRSAVPSPRPPWDPR